MTVKKDTLELNNVYNNPGYAKVVKKCIWN